MQISTQTKAVTNTHVTLATALLLAAGGAAFILAPRLSAFEGSKKMVAENHVVVDCESIHDEIDLALTPEDKLQFLREYNDCRQSSLVMAVSPEVSVVVDEVVTAPVLGEEGKNNMFVDTEPLQ